MVRCFHLALVSTFFVAAPLLSKAQIGIVSISNDGLPANGVCSQAHAAAGSGQVVMSCVATNMVLGDTNASGDVFVRDEIEGMTVRVSVSSSMVEGNAGSTSPSVSSDGRFIAFRSEAENLVADDTNGQADIFLHDRQTGSTVRVNIGPGNSEANATSSKPSISADGTRIAFRSMATNLVAGDTNGTADIFMHDTASGQTVRVSVNSSGQQASIYPSDSPSISADGNFVAFNSFAENLVADDFNEVTDVFIHEIATGLTTRVSLTDAETEANFASVNPSVSEDGRYVAFHTFATNLNGTDPNGFIDVYVRDRLLGTTTLISQAFDGGLADGDSVDPAISLDGQRVAFESLATNLVAADTNGLRDVFVSDRAASTTERSSVSDLGEEANGESMSVSISGDGESIVFYSLASNLVPGDANGVGDVLQAAVAGGNLPPVAQDDVLVSLEDQAAAGDVFLDNGNGVDMDPDGDAFEVQAPGSYGAGGIGGTVDIAANGVFTYTPPDDKFGNATFNYTIADPSGATATATLTIMVQAVNDQPTYTASNPEVLEDAGAVALGGWAAFDPGVSNEGDAVLTYVVSNISDPSLFVAPPTVDTAGTLLFEAAADISGSSAFDVVVQDDGGTANGGDDTSEPQTFTLSILPVNDAPTFTAVDPAVVLEDAGEQFIDGWASFDDGSPNETDNVLGYQVSGLSNPSLFALPPEVDAAGNLSYQPSSNAFGSSTFYVLVQDDGGTANFGIDTSEPQTFTITVEPVNDPPSFTTGPNPIRLPGASGPQIEHGWILNFDPGPNESDGLVEYVAGVIDDANGILEDVARPVEVVNDDELVFDLTGASGVARFVVEARDDGGQANGGIDFSAPVIREIHVLFEPPEGAYSWWWGSSFPELYSPSEVCCFDLDGDSFIDDAFGSLLASFEGLLGANFNADLADEYESGAQAWTIRWASAPVAGVAGDVQLDILSGSWFGASGFADREMGLGDYVLNELPAGETEVPTLQGSVAADGSLALTGDWMPFPFQLLDASLDTVIRDVVAEGQVTDTAPDCNGLCSVDDTDSGREPPQVGGLRVGGVLLLDDYFEATDGAIRDCSCSGIDPGQAALTFGENVGGGTYDVECTDSANNADFGACPIGGFCEQVETLCTTIGIFAQSADLDYNDNGIVDAFSVGGRIGFSGANVVGCEGNTCVFPTNQPPAAQPDVFGTNEDTAVVGNVLADNGAGADLDPDGDALTVTTAGAFPATGLGGNVVLEAGGVFTYTPPADATGLAGFDYTIADPLGETASATVTIDVSAAADLVVDKISNSFFTPPGSEADYEILVVNAGPSDVAGAQVLDAPPASLSVVSWTCTPFDGALCQDANGVDAIDQSVTLPEGGSLLYLLTGTTPPDSNDPITNIASVTAPAGLLELDPANNSDSDTDQVGLFADSMESVEP